MSCEQLSQNIARYRREAGLTQEELGNLLSMSMQAVSRWERGGSPDIGTLPDLAEALGVTIDDLYSYTSKKPVDISALLREELRKIPPEQRFSRANELAWELFKSVIGSYDNNGEILSQMAAIHSQVDRKNLKDPGAVASLIYCTSNEGIMKASVAKDFQYTLMMPEPEDGFAAVMKYEAEYIRLFTLLAKPNYLKTLVFICSGRKNAFTAGCLASHLQTTEAEAEAILEEFQDHNLVQSAQVDIPNGSMQTYFSRAGLSLVPFLYFGAEVMRNYGQYMLVYSSRDKLFFDAPLGQGGLMPEWITKEPRQEKGEFPFGQIGLGTLDNKTSQV